MTDEIAPGEAIAHDLNEAIGATIGRHEGGFVTKWIVLIESAGPDGERGLWSFASEGVKQWDTVGMLQHILHREAARTVRDYDTD